jgi:hypothetical protein
MLGALLVFHLVACGGGGSSTPSSSTGSIASSSDGVATLLAASQQGQTLVLQHASPSGTVRLVLDLTRGGLVSEASVAGRNFVNADDTGRGVQFALYDGEAAYDSCAGCSGNWGWNPVLGGNRANVGSPVLSSSLVGDALQVTSQWAGTATGDDTTVEQTVTAVPNEPYAFQVDFRLTNNGTQDRAYSLQELPSAYAGAAYRRLVSYSGSQPFTGAATSSYTLAGLDTTPAPHTASERWFALVDDAGQGLTVYAPGSDTVVRGFATADTAFARLDTPLSILAGQSITGRYYLIVGDHAAARQTIYRLKAAGTDAALDLTAPVGALDAPAAGASLTGSVLVSGWAVDNRVVNGVEVRVDGQRVADAALGVLRPDVQAAVAGAPGDAGFTLPLDTRAWANGAHTIEWRARDAAGNTHLQRRQVTFSN